MIPGSSLPFPLPNQFTDDEYGSFLAWWKADGITSHAITSHLAPHVLSIILPDEYDDGNPCTACIMLMAVCDAFGLVNYAHTAVLKEQLFAIQVTAPKVNEYATKWHATITQLWGTGYPIAIIELLQHFVDHLPNTTSYSSICDLVHCIISNGNHALLPTFKKLAADVTSTHFNYVHLHLTVPPPQSANAAVSLSSISDPLALILLVPNLLTTPLGGFMVPQLGPNLPLNSAPTTTTTL